MKFSLITIVLAFFTTALAVAVPDDDYKPKPPPCYPKTITTTYTKYVKVPYTTTVYIKKPYTTTIYVPKKYTTTVYVPKTYTTTVYKTKYVPKPYTVTVYKTKYVPKPYTVVKYKTVTEYKIKTTCIKDPYPKYPEPTKKY